MSENYAAVLYGPSDLRVQKWPMPEVLNDNEVLIKVACVGICGSDLKLYSTGRCGMETLTSPIVLGHEGAGTVIQVGPAVSSLQKGDRVAIEPTQPCRSCAHCRRGRYNLCDEPRYCSTTGVSGNLCQYYKHVADFCHKIPDELSMEEGAAVQPLAIAIHACARAGVALGARVLVLGAGPIGVLCALTARAMGATSVLITDVVKSRLETAKSMGVGYTLLTHNDDNDEDTVNKVVSILGVNPDITFDACGFPAAQRVAMMVTRTGGVVLVVGIGDAAVRVPLAGALLREVDIRGAYRLLNSYPAALSALASGVIDLKPFITHHFPLDRSKEAVEFAKTGEAMKIIIHI